MRLAGRMIGDHAEREKLTMPQFEPKHTPEVDAVTRGYLDCAEWLLDESADRDACVGWSVEAIANAVEECADFIAANGDDVAAYVEKRPEESAGHDFFLTRNGHGAGFWDRGLGALGERLTKAAHAYSSRDAYMGDDGFLYFI
jgi:hypothetical protein